MSDSRFAAIRIPACAVRLAPPQLALLASLLQFPVALGGIAACRPMSMSLGVTYPSSHVRHARDANKLLEIPSDELRSVVGDDSRLRFRVFLLGSF